MDSSRSPSTKPLYRGVQIVWYVLGIVEAILAFRLILKMLGANPNAEFTHFIYSISYPFTAPFVSVFQVIKMQSSIFEWTTVLAMFVYWVVAVGIIRLFLMSRSVSTPEAAYKLSNQDTH